MRSWKKEKGKEREEKIELRGENCQVKRNGEIEIMGERRFFVGWIGWVGALFGARF